MVEIGIKGFFRVTVEITSDLSFPLTLLPVAKGSFDHTVFFGQFLRFGATVKTPITGTIRHFGFDKS
jgi:hypothetical protein